MKYDEQRGLDIMRFISEQEEEYVRFPDSLRIHIYFLHKNGSTTHLSNLLKREKIREIDMELQKNHGTLEVLRDLKYVAFGNVHYGKAEWIKHGGYNETRVRFKRDRDSNDMLVFRCGGLLIRPHTLINDDIYEEKYANIRLPEDRMIAKWGRFKFKICRLTAAGHKRVKTAKGDDQKAIYCTPENRRRLFTAQRNMLNEPGKATCPQCQNEYLNKDLVWARIKPDALGGKYEEGNVQLWCYNCNLKHGDQWI